MRRVGEVRVKNTGVGGGRGEVDLGEVDVCVIGGGVNGAGIARDAAGRGLSVLLCEKGDLGEGTSSRSGKLIHGGLRYLEYLEFRLVREALIEREVLLESAPHIVWPMRFVMPQGSGDRSRWLVRIGLLLYDTLGRRRRLPGTRTLDLARAAEGAPLKSDFRVAYEYSDCWVDDARLVVLAALDAAERGARILTRCPCVEARRESGQWLVSMREEATGAPLRVRARALVNAAGPWVEEIVTGVAGRNSALSVRLVKGSHLITRKFWTGEQAYLIQNDDRRVIFVNPFEDDLALIGTTDIPFKGRPEDVATDAQEVDYLLRALGRYFIAPPGSDDIVAKFSGVRPLHDDAVENPSAVTRDYTFDLDVADGAAPMLSVFGGKITTFRKLSEHAMEKLAPFFPGLGSAWTARAQLPGGEGIDGADFPGFLARFRAAHPWLPAALAHRLARRYGDRAERLLDGARSLEDLGPDFGPDLYEAEIAYLMRNEWARTAEDVLERRTKAGLRVDAATRARLDEWMAAPDRKNASSSHPAADQTARPSGPAPTSRRSRQAARP